MSRLLKSAVKTAGDRFFWPRAQAEFLSLLDRHSSCSGADVLAITKSFKGSGWYRSLRAFQVDSEFVDLVNWASQQAPSRIMEIGTASGATLLAWCRIAAELVISVDLPGGIHGGGYVQQKQRLYRLFTHGRPDVSLHLLQKNSQLASTRSDVDAILGGRKLDMLFIDGDHRLEGVTADYDLWRTTVRPGGFIIFHDILKHKHLDNVHVDVLWNRLKQDRPHVEIVNDPEQGWAGIGILQIM